MQVLTAISLAPDANNWLRDSQHPRILHVFDSACNLINEHGNILSVVTPQIGNGPFNLVLEEAAFFSELLGFEPSISIQNDQLVLDDLIINTANAKLWSPRPVWERLYDRREHILDQVTKFPMPNYSFPAFLLSNLAAAVAKADFSASIQAAIKLAGLGPGLTPAGDDIILGAMYAAWIIHAPQVAGILAEEITETAAPLTTSLSGAWLRSAGKGETGILWHEFFDVLIGDDFLPIQQTMGNILAVGEASGADAMTGFMSTYLCWKEKDSKYG